MGTLSIYKSYLKSKNKGQTEIDKIIDLHYPNLGVSLKIGTLILMYDGTLKQVQDIVIGDIIMGPDSKPRNILNLKSGSGELYEIKSKCSSYTANESHMLSLLCVDKKDMLDSLETLPNIEHKLAIKKNKHKPADIVNIPIKDYIESDSFFKKTRKGYRVPINFNNCKDLPIDPYIVGTLLCLKNTKMSQLLCFGSSTYLYKNYEFVNDNQKLDFLEDIKKYPGIPISYKCSTKENRIKLLNGIIEKYGYHTPHGINIKHTNKILIEDIQFVSRSLGKASYITCSFHKYNILIYKNSNGSSNSYNSSHAYNSFNLNDTRYDFKVIPRGTGLYCGFEIDSDKRFVMGDFSVTFSHK